MVMGWRGKGWLNTWPGRGPFSDLHPWQRPGWLYGRGSCWRIYGPYEPILPMKAEDEVTLLKEQKKVMKEQLKTMQETMKKIQERLDELKK